MDHHHCISANSIDWTLKKKKRKAGYKDYRFILYTIKHKLTYYIISILGYRCEKEFDKVYIALV